MKENEALAKAIRIASESFQNKMDKGGAPYILHCLTVMSRVKHLGFKVMTAAVLHDLLEDCSDWTAKKLLEEGFDEDIISMIETLTRRKDEDYLTYIGRISIRPETKAIKLADLTHNMNAARLSDLSDKTMERMKKYYTAYQFLITK